MNEQINKEKNYDELILDYIKKGIEIEDMTNGLYQIEKTLEEDEVMLRGFLLKTDLCKQLEKEKGEYTFIDLKNFALEYKNMPDTLLINKLIEQYEFNEQLINLFGSRIIPVEEYKKIQGEY